MISLNIRITLLIILLTGLLCKDFKLRGLCEQCDDYSNYVDKDDDFNNDYSNYVDKDDDFNNGKEYERIHKDDDGKEYERIQVEIKKAHNCDCPDGHTYDNYVPFEIETCDLIGRPGCRGSNGQPGVPGCRGDDGRPGYPGAKGSSGLDGEQGKDGAPGAKGAQGIPGLKGNPGVPGEPGILGKEAIGPTGIPGIQGEQGPIGQTGSRGRSCHCKNPFVYTRKLNAEAKWNPSSDLEFENIDNSSCALDLTLNYADGIVVATANGGINIPCKRAYKMEFNFVTKEDGKPFELFTHATPSQTTSNTEGSPYYRSKDNDLILPLTFQQCTYVKSKRVVLRLYAKGKAGTTFYALGCQYIYFPKCKVY